MQLEEKVSCANDGEYKQGQECKPSLQQVHDVYLYMVFSLLLLLLLIHGIPFTTTTTTTYTWSSLYYYYYYYYLYMVFPLLLLLLIHGIPFTITTTTLRILCKKHCLVISLSLQEKLLPSPLHTFPCYHLQDLHTCVRIFS